MSRSSKIFALALAASTAAIILPAHAYKPGFEKPPKCTVKKVCVQFQKHCVRAPGPQIATCKQICMKWQETKICD